MNVSYLKILRSGNASFMLMYISQVAHPRPLLVKQQTRNIHASSCKMSALELEKGAMVEQYTKRLF